MSGLHSALTGPTHNPMPYSCLLLEATFIESKGLHGNNMVCQKGKHLFRVRENTFSKSALSQKKKQNPLETPTPYNSLPNKYQL